MTPIRRAKDDIDLLSSEELLNLSDEELQTLEKQRAADWEERAAIQAETEPLPVPRGPSPEAKERFEVGQWLMHGEFERARRWLDGQLVKGRPAIALSEIDAIFAELPPVPYLVQALDICPGAPTLLAGYGFSGKTVAAQAFALAVAGGGSIWGAFTPARRGRVVHLDYEQGSRLTFERYQRLARAADLRLEDLRGQIGVAALPGLTLDVSGAVDAVSKACEGAALLIVDSLRAAAPSVEENSSEVRGVLDMLGVVSERTGVVPLVLHHARKPARDQDGGARVAIRGSSAIFDACGSVLVFEGAKGEPTSVSHEKARTSGITAEDFALTVADVAIDGDPRGGLEVRVAGVKPRAERQREAATTRTKELDAAVLDFVRRNPGSSTRSISATDELTGRAESRRDSLTRLRDVGLIEERTAKRGVQFWPLAQVRS